MVAASTVDVVTERKPRTVSFETWVEKQVREAQERGAFDALPGTGKPLPPGAYEEGAWIRDKARRENLPVAAMLPPGLALRKEVEDLPARLARERTEPRVRALLLDLAARIDAWNRGPQEPPLYVRRLDVELRLQAWRDTRALVDPVVVVPVVEVSRRRWSLRRRATDPRR